MDQVKRLVGAGATISGAIKEALAQKGLTVAAFAEKYTLNRSAVAHHLNATMRPSDFTVDALVAELGGDADGWRELLWLAAKPDKVAL